MEKGDKIIPLHRRYATPAERQNEEIAKALALREGLFPKPLPVDVVVTDADGTIQHVEYKMGEDHQAENRFKRDRRPVTMVEIAKGGSPQEQVKLWNDWMVRNSTYGKGGHTLTIHAVDREKLDRELERHLGADDDEFAKQFARETAALVAGWLTPFRTDRPLGEQRLTPLQTDRLLHEETFDSRYARFKSGTEAAWRREETMHVKSGREWPPYENGEPVSAERLAELDWSIQPPSTPAKRKRLIWGSRLVLGGVVALAIAAIAAGIKLVM